MSFLILVVTLYAFGQINIMARELSATAQLQDVTNRVSLAVQDNLVLAGQRNDTRSDFNSSLIRYERAIDIPDTVQGWTFRVSLDPNFVNATSDARTLAADPVPTFNAAVSLPPTPAGCTLDYLVCEISGVVSGNSGRIVITYLLDASLTPPVNRISIIEPG